MKPKKLLSIPVLAVFIVMGFVYYNTVFVFLEDWVGLHSSVGSLNSLIFSLLAFFSLYSFLFCVLTDPGCVPSNYVPDEEGQCSPEEIHKNLRRCDKCYAYKPPRSHHCRVCKSCILKMDHHCIWVNNCVGYRNHKAFLLLVLYGALGSTYSTVIFVSSTLQKDWASQSGSLKGFYIACGVLMVGLCMSLITLLAWHIYLVTHNMTTIEYYEGLRTAWLARKSGQSYRHLYDVGAYRNITLILGQNMLKWLCPVSVSHLKDGTDFPTTRDSSS
ncbi:hypothetical protein Nepgr_001263 [Nepenthes gracilis]|uniref:S-acyltransferase n=1 Tax=Nepenthes gracilis TaxID=150966 RepID=A0AAD3P7Y0_NEPGR|nr:hypothetical protein Nepgr_001263 [Nepenthes gracilis]